MSTNMRGGWKVTASEYNRQLDLTQQYNQTPPGQAKLNFGIFVPILAIVLLVLFG